MSWCKLNISKEKLGTVARGVLSHKEDLKHLLRYLVEVNASAYLAILLYFIFLQFLGPLYSALLITALLIFVMIVSLLLLYKGYSVNRLKTPLFSFLLTFGVLVNLRVNVLTVTDSVYAMVITNVAVPLTSFLCDKLAQCGNVSTDTESTDCESIQSEWNEFRANLRPARMFVLDENDSGTFSYDQEDAPSESADQEQQPEDVQYEPVNVLANNDVPFEHDEDNIRAIVEAILGPPEADDLTDSERHSSDEDYTTDEENGDFEVVHNGFLRQPSMDSGFSHELNVGDVLNIIADDEEIEFDIDLEDRVMILHRGGEYNY